MNEIVGDIYIASFDIGDINFAIYIESFDIIQLKELNKKYKKNERWNNKTFIDEVCMNGKRIYTEVKNLRGDVKDKNLTNRTRINLFEYLDSLSNLLRKVDIILVENQYQRIIGRGMKRRVEANMKAIKISECVMTYFLLRYPEKHIELFQSSNKTHTLGAPKSIKTKPERKKWCTIFAEDVYNLRDDKGMKLLYKIISENFNKKRDLKKTEIILKNIKNKEIDILILLKLYLNEKQKLDDISDCLCQAQAYKIKLLKDL